MNKLDIDAAFGRLQPLIKKTPLQRNDRLSEAYSAEIYLKREDLQKVRSYKIRGAYNRMMSLPEDQRKKGIVCASGGNHAQGVAYVGKSLGIKSVIYMPAITPMQKINQVKLFGGDSIEIVLTGDNFDECQTEAREFARQNNMEFISAFDHEKIIEGQGTVAKEILDELTDIDYLLIPVGGGGLIAGMSYYFHEHSPATKIIGVEPMGAPSMSQALEAGQPVLLETMDPFVDGASIQKIGQIPFEISKDLINKMVLVPEGKACSAILKLYNEEAIVAEPAGALTIASLDYVADEIKGKKVVCIISGGNNDIERMEEIRNRSLLYEGLKHYFILRIAQRPGTIKDVLNHILGSEDDIFLFEFTKKHNKASSPVLIGIEVRTREDFHLLIKRMDDYKLDYTLVNQDDNLFEYLV